MTVRMVDDGALMAAAVGLMGRRVRMAMMGMKNRNNL